MGVPHSLQKYLDPCEEDSNSFGFSLVYLKRSFGTAIHETKAAPEMLLHIEQWQFEEGYSSCSKLYLTEPQKQPPSEGLFIGVFLGFVGFFGLFGLGVLQVVKGWQRNCIRKNDN